MNIVNQKYAHGPNYLLDELFGSPDEQSDAPSQNSLNLSHSAEEPKQRLFKFSPRVPKHPKESQPDQSTKRVRSSNPTSKNKAKKAKKPFDSDSLIGLNLLFENNALISSSLDSERGGNTLQSSGCLEHSD
jgi:hypothetical protein